MFKEIWEYQKEYNNFKLEQKNKKRDEKIKELQSNAQSILKQELIKHQVSSAHKLVRFKDLKEKSENSNFEQSKKSYIKSDSLEQLALIPDRLRIQVPESSIRKSKLDSTKTTARMITSASNAQAPTFGSSNLSAGKRFLTSGDGIKPLSLNSRTTNSRNLVSSSNTRTKMEFTDKIPEHKEFFYIEEPLDIVVTNRSQIQRQIKTASGHRV